MEIVLSQSVDQVKEYHRCGSSLDGIDLIIEYKDGKTESFRSNIHMFQKTVDEIQNHWKNKKQ